MIPVTYRDDEQIIDQLDQIAGEHDLDRAAVLREAVREYLRDYAGDAPTNYGGDAATEALARRVSAVEDRLDELEDVIDSPGDAPVASPTDYRHDADSDAGPDASVDHTRDATADATSEHTADVDRLARSVLDERAETFEDRHRAVGGALEYLQDHGTARRKHMLDDVEPEFAIPSQKPETWWESTVRPALRELAGEETTPIDLSGRVFEWTGE